MPAKSRAQRMAMAIAEHSPGKLYSRNKGMLSMSKDALRDYAETSEAGLPMRAKAKKYGGMKGKKK
jgi:hypothetical protein